MNLLIKAIEEEETLSKKQRNILIRIYNFHTPVSAPKLSSSIKQQSRQHIHATLQTLMKKGFISREKDRIFLYSVREEKMKELIDKQRNKKYDSSN